MENNLTKIINGNCLEVMKTMEDNSVDSIVTDPPYGLSFMGKKWDYDVPSIEIWEEALRVLKPGGYLLAFGGTRTCHRMACAIEDAGFEIRDMIAWVYGSGFPKSLNIGKAVDKLQGNEREVLGEKETKDFSHHKGSMMGKETTPDDKTQTTTITETKGTSPYEGFGTALKPALEPICVARKPLSEKTVASNVLKWGTGGINIDGCRVEMDKEDRENYINKRMSFVGTEDKDYSDRFTSYGMPEVSNKDKIQRSELGRFPANIILDGSDEVVSLFPNTKSGNLNAGHKRGDGTGNSFMGGGGTVTGNYGGDHGSASRFFYCAKSSKIDRNEGCEELEEKSKVFNGQSKKPSSEMKDVEERFTTQPAKNFHPTVKPTKLMQYLVRLVTPKGGICLDPFMGSGSTGKACVLENFNFVGIEMDKEYCAIAEARIEWAKKEMSNKLF